VGKLAQKATAGAGCYYRGMIDTLKLFETLKTGDLADPHARAIVQAIENAFADDEPRQAKVLASKIDAAKLDAEVRQVETSLKQDIFELRTELRATATQLQAEFKGELAQVEGRLGEKIAKSETAMIRWMFIFWIGQVAAWKFLK
jgi:hypothetical protein